MPAFMIVTAQIADREAFIAGYGKRAAELVTRFGGRYLVRAPGAQVLEGASRDGASVVISEWPDRDAALRFWNSPEYAEAKKLREGIAECEVIVVEAPALS